jgi:hypothetical protein
MELHISVDVFQDPLRYITYRSASTDVCSGSILDEPPLYEKNSKLILKRNMQEIQSTREGMSTNQGNQQAFNEENEEGCVTNTHGGT